MKVLQIFFTKTPYNSLNFRWNYGCRIFVALIFLYTVLFSSWIGDDAAITFRQIWNFVTGNGIVFNYESRVQVFTHPLWFIVLSGFVKITGELYLTTSIISIVFSMLSVLILLSIEFNSKNDRVLLIPITSFLLFSWSFVDYMTSGLENPLSYFLTSLLLLTFTSINWRNYYSFIFFLISLLVLNRIDYVIIFFPLAIYLAFSTKNISYLIKSIMPGSLVLILWFFICDFLLWLSISKYIFCQIKFRFYKK